MAPYAQATSQSPAPAIQILSTDILHSIFVALIKSVPHHARVSTAINMAYVCCFWRDITFSIPFIWGYINGDLSPRCPTVVWNRNHIYTDQEVREMLELVAERWREQINSLTKRAKVLISKSCDAPLALDFTLSGGIAIYPDEASGWLVPLADALHQTTARWEEATFTIDPSPWNRPLVRILALRRQEFSQLRKFKLHMPPPAVLDLEELGVLQSPTLQSLSLSAVCKDFSCVHVSWGSLTHLSLRQPATGKFPRSLGSAEVLNILQNCWELVSCSFVFDKPFLESDLTVRSRIRLPHLESISLKGVPTAKGFASSLDLPSLRTLNLEQEDRGGFMDWAVNFGDQLEDLKFDYSSVSQWDLHFCIQRLSNVVGFSSNFLTHLPSDQNSWTQGEKKAVFSDFTLGILTPGVRAQQPCCPKLQEFSFRHNRAAFTEAALVEFIVARTDSKILPDGFSPLRSVDVDFYGFSKMDIKNILADRGVHMENLNLKIIYSHCV